MSIAKKPELVVRMARLELVAASLPLVEAEQAGAAHLSSLLQSQVRAWPPPLNDQKTLTWTVEQLRR